MGTFAESASRALLEKLLDWFCTGSAVTSDRSTSALSADLVMCHNLYSCANRMMLQSSRPNRRVNRVAEASNWVMISIKIQERSHSDLDLVGSPIATRCKPQPRSSS